MVDINFDQYSINEVFVDAIIVTDEELSDNHKGLDIMAHAGMQCCWQFVYEMPVFKEMMTGYGRIIYYHKDKGILSYQEGHFTKGKQDGFGRFISLYDDNEYDLSLQMFTGYFPDE